MYKNRTSSWKALSSDGEIKEPIFIHILAIDLLDIRLSVKHFFPVGQKNRFPCINTEFWFQQAYEFIQFDGWCDCKSILKSQLLDILFFGKSEQPRVIECNYRKDTWMLFHRVAHFFPFFKRVSFFEGVLPSQNCYHRDYYNSKRLYRNDDSIRIIKIKLKVS